MEDALSINLDIYRDVNRIMDQVSALILTATRSITCKKELSEEHKECIIQAIAILNTISDMNVVAQDCSLVLQTCILSLRALLNILKSKANNAKELQLSIPNKPSKRDADVSFCYAPNTRFDDIIGSDDAKMALIENVILPLRLSKLQSEAIFTGIRGVAANILLHGPPGTGKTSLAEAAANEADADFFCIRPSDILSKYQGESERFLRDLFEIARKRKRAVIFFDEFDSIAITRSSGDDGAQSRRLLAELLLQLSHQQQIRKRKNKRQTNKPHQASVIYDNCTTIESDSVGDSCDGDTSSVDTYLAIIAATNRISDLDEAALRRFDCKIFVGVPSASSRKAIILSCIQDISHDLADPYDLDEIARVTYGWSGSDIQALCREAAMIPVREYLRMQQQHNHQESFEPPDGKGYGSPIKLRPIVRSDFEAAMSNLIQRPIEN